MISVTVFFLFFIAANMESLADNRSTSITERTFYEFILSYYRCEYTDICTSNIYATKDNTYHNLRGMIQNKGTVVERN